MITRKKASRNKPSVRMYNVGFGDAFLIRLPDGRKTRTILLDCGMHLAGNGPLTISEVVERIVQDITDGSTRRIDVVIATHRHQDHISGFANEIWEDVEVGEVWLPWTENPSDPLATEIRERQTRIARLLELASLKLSGTDRAMVEAMALNSYSNEKAMLTLHEGFAGAPVRKFLPSRSLKENTFTTENLPGVVVHAMGPSFDPKVIRDMNPPEGQSYLRMKGLEESSDGGAAPFGSGWAISVAEYLKEFQFMNLSRADQRAISERAYLDELAVAVALEKAVNGTSLFLVLQIGKAVLTLPGDAQWGTWKSVLENDEYVSLLRKTSFLKIGHHASHNGTPVALVEKVLGNTFFAMASTKHLNMWENIPKKMLLQKLRSKSADVVRSDVQDVKDAKRWRRTEFYVETEFEV